MEDQRLKIGEIRTVNGMRFTYVAEFIENEDIFHIVEHKGKWSVLKGGEGKATICLWIPGQAMDVLKLLPNTPYDYKPFMQWLSRS